ncbi:queuosine precursor transporter [Chlamydia vaughanii]|uniref:queuosine precursor transporter n=1 Tax=Chlamydia vaughanii TaxID=3112552 RepID=UPI0032B254C2
MSLLLHKDRVFFSLSLIFSLVLILSNLVAASRLIVTPFFTIPGGLVFYPMTFVISNIVNEVFGSKQARRMVFSAFAGNVFSLLILQIISFLPTSSPEMARAWHTIFDISPIAFLASFSAFAVSQQLDILSFRLLKQKFPKSPPWIRNTLSTCLSQIADTIVVDLGILYMGMHLPFTQTLQIMAFSYLYKLGFSVITIPVFYFSVRKLELN